MPTGEPANAAKTRPIRRRPNAMPGAAARMPANRRTDPPVLEQAFDAPALPRLRSAVAAYAELLGAGPALDDVVLIAHELSSNAVRHGGGSGRLRLWRDGMRIMCRVSDPGRGLPEAQVAGAVMPSARTPGGRGLWIARRLADVRIDSGPTGTTVTAAIPLTSAF